MLEPDCECGADVILSSEEGDTTDEMLAKSLSDFNVNHGAELVAEDFQQDFRVTVHVEHAEELDEDHREAGYQLVGALEVLFYNFTCVINVLFAFLNPTTY